MILDLIRLMLNRKALGKSPTRKGQRVYLNPSEAPSHPTTPYKGSIDECEGTVERFIDNVAMIWWDNGESGSFSHNRLTVCDFPFKPNPLQFYPNLDEKNPNIAFKRWKIKMFGESGIKQSYIFADDMEKPYHQRFDPAARMLSRGYIPR